MNFENIGEKNQGFYNLQVNHPLQAYEWGEFRKKTGVNVIRRGQVLDKKLINLYQITIHKTPSFPYLIGYFPKGELPSQELLDDLEETGKTNKLSFIQLEPNVLSGKFKFESDKLKKSFHPLLTKYTFVLDLTKNEDELLINMHQKTRYNIKVSQKHNVKFEIDNSSKAFEEYIRLTEQTTKRQKFYAHGEAYHRLMWETLRSQQSEASSQKHNPNKLQAHLLTAKFKQKILVTYILFTFKDTLYYPYGASSSEYRETMAATGAMWEAIKFGKNLGLKKFDMWGAANVADPKPNNPYYGFHRFKQGFGAQLTEFVGSYDLVISPINYRLLSVADKLRWAYLKAKKK